MALIDAGVKGPLTLLSAPAGFGKTQLLAEWANERTMPIAWLTLSPEDNDYVRFFRYLSSAFQEVEPPLSEAILDYLQVTESSRLEMATLLINQVSTIPRDLILVVDEYHVLEDATLIVDFNFLLKHLPPNLHVIIASRTEQSLDLALLRARGQVTEIGTDDLRLTHEEIRQFFDQTMHMQIPPETLRTLEERTEGWAIGLQLAALSLRNPSHPTDFFQAIHGDVPYLAEFLAQEVLDQQSEEVRQFLLCNSILDVLSGPLCETVAGMDSAPGYGSRMLNQLVHQNLFITPLDERHHWFRLHNLFVDFLRHRLTETHAADISQLHRRAATWFEQNGNRDEAFKHGLATGDTEWAAKLIDRNIETLVEKGEASTLTYWIRKLPQDCVHTHPRLGLAYAWGLIASHQLDDAEFWLDDVQQTLNSPDYEKSQPAPTPDGQNIPLRGLLGALALCRSMAALARGDFGRAAEYSREALDYLEDGNPFIRGMMSLEESMYCILLGDTAKAIEVLQETAKIARRTNNLFVLIVATCELADMQMLQGRLSQALATLEKARLLAVGPDERPLALAGIIDNGLGEILRERNQLDEAKEFLERGRRLTQAEWAPSSLEAVVSLARLLQSQGHLAESQMLIEEAFRLVLGTENSQWDEIVITATAVRLALQRDDLAAAYRWWEQSRLRDFQPDIAQENIPYHVLEYLLLTRARYDLAVGRNTGDTRLLSQSLSLLQLILAKAEQFKRVSSQIEIQILQAMIAYALDEPDQAVRALLRGLALGEPDDYCRIFLDEGPIMGELLTRCWVAQQQSGAFAPSLQYISSLLNISKREAGLFASRTLATASAAQTQSDYTVLLSARELEVLSMIAAGKSNQEIAEQLFLALNTVKRHASNIFDKLEVKKRTEAVAKARQLGLIP
jgi:LuxR family maltose regulon positive regulatory protein